MLRFQQSYFVFGLAAASFCLRGVDLENSRETLGRDVARVNESWFAATLWTSTGLVLGATPATIAFSNGPRGSARWIVGVFASWMGVGVYLRHSICVGSERKRLLRRCSVRARCSRIPSVFDCCGSTQRPRLESSVQKNNWRMAPHAHAHTRGEGRGLMRLAHLLVARQIRVRVFLGRASTRGQGSLSQPPLPRRRGLDLELVYVGTRPRRP